MSKKLSHDDAVEHFVNTLFATGRDIEAGLHHVTSAIQHILNIMSEEGALVGAPPYPHAAIRRFLHDATCEACQEAAPKPKRRKPAKKRNLH